MWQGRCRGLRGRVAGALHRWLYTGGLVRAGLHERLYTGGLVPATLHERLYTETKDMGRAVDGREKLLSEGFTRAAGGEGEEWTEVDVDVRST